MSRPARRTPFLLSVLASAMLGAAPAAHSAPACIDATGGLDIDGGGRDIVLGLPVQSGARFGAAVLGIGPDEPDFEGCDWRGRLTSVTCPAEAGPPQDRAGFGSRLGGLNIGLMAAGAPGADVGGAQDAGSIAVTLWEDGTRTKTVWMDQDSPGAGGTAEPGDR